MGFYFCETIESMYSIIKFFLFKLPPEKAHHFTVSSWKTLLSLPLLGWLAKKLYHFEKPELKRHLFGLDFINPVGLAAGFDKEGKYFEAMASLGFGFVEIGTVTPKGQEGNPKPRMFRLPQDKALINRMGFNNEGLEALVSRLKQYRNKGGKLIIGGNIGKNKLTPNESASDDYVTCFDALHQYVDYFVVNVSSPNTPGLRALQEKEPLTNLLTLLQNRNQTLETSRPILLKIAPDLTNDQLDDIIEIVQTTKLNGVIATNTTVDRSNLNESPSRLKEIGNGGLSGQPLKKRSTEIVKYLSEKSNKAFSIIGVGGIQTPEDAQEKLNAGADLVQIYTGMIYEGPSIVRNIKKAIKN